MERELKLAIYTEQIERKYIKIFLNETDKEIYEDMYSEGPDYCDEIDHTESDVEIFNLDDLSTDKSLLSYLDYAEFEHPYGPQEIIDILKNKISESVTSDNQLFFDLQDGFDQEKYEKEEKEKIIKQESAIKEIIKRLGKL